MTSTARKLPPVGSAPWAVSERRQASELVDQEVEEFEYSVRNEMEWLNEHMHDIFAGNNMNVADIFKTPGKLRGKTPRTARKRNALGQRAPLTDIFAPNPQAHTSPTKTQFYKQVAQFQVAEDAISNENQAQVAVAAEKPHHAPRAKGNADSGYHGLTDDEMDVDRPQIISIPVISPPREAPQTPKARFASLPREEHAATETEESFVSAKENPSRTGSREDLREDDASSTVPDDHMPEMEAPETAVEAQIEPEEPAIVSEPEAPAVATEPEREQADDDLDHMDEDDVRSPSDKSSPVKPLLRKSSLTFSSLPAREPLAHKKSIGARTSRTSHIDAFRGTAGRFTGGKSLGGQQHAPASIDDPMDVDEPEMNKPSLEREESETTKKHHQTTTQRLHDRINMLGQSRDSRLSKSIPLNSVATQSIYPQLPQAQPEKAEVEMARPVSRPDLNKQLPANPAQDDDDDDWIAPVKSIPIEKEAPRPALFRSRTAESTQQNGKAKETEPEMAAPAPQESPRRRFSPSRPKLPFGHKKTVSSSAISSPTRSAMAPEPSQKPISVSNPTLQSGNTTTTPAGSPRRHLDGAVSATKAKLYSALRSAKGIFASSAGVSAQAKMEAFNSPAPRLRQQRDDLFNDVFSPTEETAPEPALYPNLGDRITSAESVASASTEGRRTRSSSEREQKKQNEQRKMGGDLEKAREKERQKAAAAASKLQMSPSKERLAAQRPMAPSRTESERSRDEEMTSADEMPPPPAPRSMLPTTQSQRLREPRRIVKPVKDAQTKTRPTPVPIRMPSQRIGHAQAPSTTDLSRSLQESLQHPAVSSKPALTSKPSSASLHASASSTSLKASGSSQAAKRTLEAAAKKKEQEAKAAQRKAEQKREMEQRRAAKAEEERRRQEDERRKQDEERRRQDDERRAEQQRRAAEQQRREEAKRAAQRQAVETKRMEQQRKEAQRAQGQAQHNEFAYALQQDKLNQQAPHGRADLGGARPLSRMNLVPEPQRPIQVNPAKPAKRALQTEQEDEQHSRPAMQRNQPSYQQNDAKRRKTDEDEPPEPRKSVMAPPVRQSNIRKENKFPHGYAPAPPAHHPAPSMFVKTVTAQHQLHHGQASHHNDMAKFANARIPFADAPNPPAGPSGAQHKTPGRPIPNGGIKSAAKSSPLYPNGDNISLPEIASDSEDDEDEFQAPDWVNSPALRELLTQQQLVDPEAIFGPIAPLRMEEVFKNKDRHKKFRDRTSSANWSGQDRLTEEERQRDREAREKMMNDGGWTFQPN